jgi:hypothetical protein
MSRSPTALEYKQAYLSFPIEASDPYSTFTVENYPYSGVGEKFCNSDSIKYI